MRNFYNDISWSFLISSPSHTGDFFEEAVILLLEDNEDGAFGIAINKPRGKSSERFPKTLNPLRSKTLKLWTEVLSKAAQ